MSIHKEDPVERVAEALERIADRLDEFHEMLSDMTQVETDVSGNVTWRTLRILNIND